MDSPLSNIDELLSGMLDGILTDAEVRQLEEALAKDASIQRRLDELSSIRRSLLSSRPRRFLGAEFAKKVTEGARAKAISLGADAPSWLVETVEYSKPVSPQVTLPNSSWRSARPWLYAAALASAAVVAFVFMVPTKQDSQPLIGNLPEFKNQPTQNPDEKIGAEELLASEPFAHEPSEPSKSALANNAETPKTSDGVTEDSAVIAMENSNKTDEVSKAPESRTELVENSVKAIPGVSNQKTARISLVAVLDISIDAAAIENSALEVLLEKHGIAFANDLNISEEQLKALEDSRMIGNGAETERIGVMFLKGSARNVSLAMTDIIKQYNDFPDCSMNMAMDEASKELVKQLSSIEVAADKGGVAQSLTVAGVAGKSPFPASSRRGLIYSREMREKQNGGMLLGKSSEVSYALLLIRPPKAK